MGKIKIDFHLYTQFKHRVLEVWRVLQSHLWGSPIPILPGRTVIIRNITMLLSAASLQPIDRPEFYIDDELKHAETDHFSWLLVP